jgi:hypothetical protein
MWDKKLADLASKYPTGILSVVEPSGYPISVRCTTQFDETSETIHFPGPPQVALSWRGKACILFHYHDEHLEGLRQLAIKGELVDDGDGGKPALHVTEFVTANGRPDTDEMPHAGAPLYMFQFLMLVRRKAREYMQKRGAPWPPIPFDEIGRKVNAAD